MTTNFKDLLVVNRSAHYRFILRNAPFRVKSFPKNILGILFIFLMMYPLYSSYRSSCNLILN